MESNVPLPPLLLCPTEPDGMLEVVEDVDVIHCDVILGDGGYLPIEVGISESDTAGWKGWLCNTSDGGRRCVVGMFVNTP